MNRTLSYDAGSFSPNRALLPAYIICQSKPQFEGPANQSHNQDMSGSNSSERDPPNLLHRLARTTPSIRPRPQTRPNLIHTLRVPRRIAPRIQHPIILSLDEIFRLRRRLGRNDVDLFLDLVAEYVQREIIRVVTERILDLSADGGDAEDDVGADDCAGYRDPLQVFPELEGESKHVHPGDLADGDGVGDWERGTQHALAAGEDFVHGDEVGHCHCLAGPVVESFVLDGGFHICGEVGEDLEGEVAEVFLGALDQLPRVGFCERETEPVASLFPV